MVNKKSREYIRLVGLGAIIVAIVIAIVLLLSPKRTSISEEVKNADTGLLECSASDIKDAFFSVDDVNSVKHILKVTFLDNNIKDISYNYVATFNSEEEVESADATLHAKYNEYMGENATNAEKLNPVFANLDNDLKISLYSEGNKLSGVTAKIFFLTTDEVKNIKRISAENLTKIYEEKGFSCKYQN